MADLKAHLIALEQERCAALLDRSEDRLRVVVAPDVTHVHGNGRVQRGDEYFAYALSAAYRLTERSDLELEIRDGEALMVGPLALTVRLTEDAEIGHLSGVALQTWKRGVAGVWQQTTFQLTPIPV